MNRKYAIIGLVSFWVILVLGFVFHMEYIKNNGNIIIAKIVPVDPRDLLRGDYVVLEFPFSRLEGIKQAPGEIYAVFSKGKDDKLITVDSYQKTKPSSKNFIKGEVDKYGHAIYGIEQFFVPEGRGMEIQNAIRNNIVEAEIAISDDGIGIIKNIIIDGKIWKP